jgi:hypothetical protein
MPKETLRGEFAITAEFESEADADKFAGFLEAKLMHWIEQELDVMDIELEGSSHCVHTSRTHPPGKTHAS